MNETQSSGRGGAFDLSQFHSVFFEEAGDNLANMEMLLLSVDNTSADDETLNAIFRCAHSIKGGAATFGFQDVADLTHVMETLLDKLRRHELNVTRLMIDTLLESGDLLKQLLACRQQGVRADVDFAPLVTRIGDLTAGRVVVVDPPAGHAAVQAASKALHTEPLIELEIGPLDNPGAVDAIAELFTEIPGLGTIESMADVDHPDGPCKRLMVRSRSSDGDLFDLLSFHIARERIRIARKDAAPIAPAPVASAPKVAAPAAPAAAASDDFGFFGDPVSAPPAAAPVAASVAPMEPVAAAPAAAPAPMRRESDRSGGGVNLESSTIRVPIEKVDQLINLVGELVITQAMLAQNGRDLDPVAHQSMMVGLADLERSTRLLQESVMAIRMIPMAMVFNRFPRMLRDLASKLGKQVDLLTIGEDTELDKGLIEKITDPLTHLVRNAADHGIEPPAERLAAGKPAQGTVTLAASHSGGSIVIEVRDDGRGLNREKLLKKAIERGIPVHDQMTDQDVYGLIFEPGFSTAAEVTDISGRGVGMDVVKRNIVSLGGSVEIDSTLGRGMRVSVRLPLTLAIMDGMSVGVGHETYILPLASVVESIHLNDEDIKSVGGTGRVVEVRDSFLPIISVRELFDVRPERDGEGGIMIVVEAEGGRIALLVDELIGQHQVVVKNLESNYRKVPGVSGATILGDGRVSLILDVSWFVRRARH